jgi:hypothetical protein
MNSEAERDESEDSQEDEQGEGSIHIDNETMPEEQQ